jgi:hypothetical protein
LSKIISTKKPSTIFLAVILLVAGVIVMSSPFVAYGEEAYQSFKCEGNNVNIDNIEQIQQLQTENNNNNNNFEAAANNQQQQMTPTGAEEGEGEPLNALTGNSNGNGNGNSEPLLTLKNVCFNFGNNENNALITPEPTTTLSVKKTIKCTPNAGTPGSVEACQRITTEILPNQFTIFVTGNNPNPDTFDGSTFPEIVTLDPGNYEVSETRDPMVDTIRANIERDVGILLDGPAPEFSGDCRLTSSSSGIGTIEEGESQVCNIANSFAPT